MTISSPFGGGYCPRRTSWLEIPKDQGILLFLSSHPSVPG